MLGDNKLYKAYHVLKNCIFPANRYKFALVCIKMQKYSDAEKALVLKSSESGDDIQVIGGAAGYYLLGTVVERKARQKEAVKYYTKALELDPTLWIAFEKLCKLESEIKPQTMFKDDHPLIASFNSAINKKYYFNKIGQPMNVTWLQQPFKSIPHIPPIQQPQVLEDPTEIPIEAENSAAKVLVNPSMTNSKLPMEIKRKLRHASTALQGDNSDITTTPGTGKRLSGKALQAPQKAKNYLNKGRISEEIKMPISELSVNPFSLPLTQSQDDQKSKTAPRPEQTIISLLSQFAIAYHALITYNCTEAIKLFKQFPSSQYNTGWTLTQIGRALFESIKYSEAEKAYKEALNIEPYRLEGLEYYSTCLWHLKKEIELCELSNRILATTVFTPETWCAVGNTFSLQKEHETALKLFNRALQLNPYFAYAHTLCGHEYVANEDFEQAKKCYQKAISCDEHHYNAFWGIGSIYLRQEKYDQAIQYFKRAIAINNRSSVLYTYLGMTYLRNRQLNEALQAFEIAEKMDPNNPLNKYQKATVLVSMCKLNEGLKVLEELQIKVPREAPVHILMGKIYKQIGNKDKALTHFNMAMDLNPKESNIIKSLIDHLDREDTATEDTDL